MSTPTTAPPVAPSPPKSRRGWYYLAGFVLLLVAAPATYYFIAAWWAERELQALLAELDENDPGWRWHDLAAEINARPADPNSAAQILKVRVLLKKKPLAAGGPWAAGKDPFEKPNVRLSGEFAIPLRTAFLTFPEETVREARKLKDMPNGSYGVEVSDQPFTIRLDHVQDTREVIRFLQMDVARQAYDGNADGAADSCLAMMNTAHALKDQPFLIALLVRIAGNTVAVGTIEHTLAQGNVSEANLQKLQALLERAAADDGLYRAMRGERAAGHQTYLNLRDGKMTFSEMFGMTNIKASFPERFLDYFPGLVLAGYPEYLERMNEQVRAGALKDAERTRAFRKIDEQAKQSRNFLTRTILPATAKVAQASIRSQAQLGCAIVAVAAERYRLRPEHKAWPKRIEDLVDAKLLKEVPIDPYDGKPLRLKRTPSGLVIYSVNFDETDNGGILDRANPRAPGIDLGFELWDPKSRASPP
ncbi:MAG: hypothetical protein HYR84_01275 [Planctomycetes bacterium]|nr:hypothetical protein [Planctomycetota bacterium]